MNNYLREVDGKLLKINLPLGTINSREMLKPICKNHGTNVLASLLLFNEKSELRFENDNYVYYVNGRQSKLKYQKSQTVTRNSLYNTLCDLLCLDNYFLCYDVTLDEVIKDSVGSLRLKLSTTVDDSTELCEVSFIVEVYEKSDLSFDNLNGLGVGRVKSLTITKSDRYNKFTNVINDKKYSDMELSTLTSNLSNELSNLVITVKELTTYDKVYLGFSKGYMIKVIPQFAKKYAGCKGYLNVLDFKLDKYNYMNYKISNKNGIEYWISETECTIYDIDTVAR